ncbi:MAG: hypothetical protein K2M79_00525 [Muribaculaceae bacterium]|nr:hypothetical protein [Muribaculaceae bacterium]
MILYYIFILLFVAIGISCIAYSVVHIFHLNPRCATYSENCSHQIRNILGGIGLIALGFLFYITKITDIAI